MTSIMKHASKVSSAYADDSIYNQIHNPDNGEHGITLGDYTSDDSIMQRELGYSSRLPNVQSAIDLLIVNSKIPILGILTTTSNGDPNEGSQTSQIDETLITLSVGTITIDPIKLILYGIVIDVDAGLTLDNIRPIIEATLIASGMFKDVVVIFVGDTITLTVTHKTALQRIPCFIENGGVHAGTFGIIDCVTTATAGNAGLGPGYGVWTFMGLETKALTSGADNTPTFYYWRRDN